MYVLSLISYVYFIVPVLCYLNVISVRLVAIVDEPAGIIYMYNRIAHVIAYC